MPTMVTSPRMMKRTIATTLIKASHDSSVPKLPTERELKYNSTRQNPSAHIQTGTCGNQYCMYKPAATASPPTAMAWAIQYVYRTTNPAQGLRYVSAYVPKEPAVGWTTAISDRLKTITSATKPASA